MGRTKATPMKSKSGTENWSLESPEMKRTSKGPHRMYKKVIAPNTANEQFYLGDIWLGQTNNLLPETWNSCKVAIHSGEEEDFLKIQFDADEFSVVTVTTDQKFLKDLFASQIFAVRFYLQNDLVYAKLYINRFPIPTFGNVRNVLQIVFNLIFNLSIDKEDQDDCKNLSVMREIMNFYSNIKDIQRNKVVLPVVEVQHKNLKPLLRPYQKDAIKWMLLRENHVESEESLHPLYESVMLQSGIEVYYSKYTGYVEVTKPIQQSLRTGGILADEMGLGKTVEVLACILAHPKELRSGKLNHPTVEKQAPKRRRETSNGNERYIDKPKKLKLSDDSVNKGKKSATRVALEMWYNNSLSPFNTTNKRTDVQTRVICVCGSSEMNDNIECVHCSKLQHAACMGYEREFGPYMCPQCWMDEPLIESGATLIVTPKSLHEQWCNEICKHISTGLRVLKYKGHTLTPVYPSKLQQYDLVLTTYNVLQSELRLTENGETMNLRRVPKYLHPGSPLTRINWWRLCLDEAQTVETPGRMISVMAKKIEATHRWAVTGTPISKDISELHGLLDYLQLQPYCDLDTWKNLLLLPYSQGNYGPMINFFSQILWRNSKNDVLEQINLPKQTTKEYWLELSAVEKYFYKHEHELSSTKFLKKLEGYDLNKPVETLNRQSLDNVLQPLLSIRQACTYPNAARGRFLATRKQGSSMKDLLEALILKNANDGEENLRIIISALNGIAGIFLLLQNPINAIEEYRNVLQLASRFEKEDIEIKIDKLQLVHTLYNLTNVLEMCPNVAPTLRDHTLTQDCLEIQQQYMKRYTTQSIAALEETVQTTAAVRKLQDSFILEPGQWYTDMMNWVTTSESLDDLRTRIFNLLSSGNNVKYNLIISTERKLLYLIANWDQNIGNLREKLIGLLKQYYNTVTENEQVTLKIDQTLVQSVMDCHLRPQKNKKSKTPCIVCVTNDYLKEYECKLFNMVKTDNMIANKGCWLPSCEELVLKGLHSLGKANKVDRNVLQDGETHLHLLESLKKEFKDLRKFWTLLDQQIKAQDELDICKIRLRLKEPEQSPTTSKPSKLVSILKQLSNDINDKLETVHMLDEHELDYQRAVLTSEAKQHQVILEKILGTHSYLETLRRQQYAGESPDPCPICKNVLEEHWSILPCGHCFCLECIQLLINQIFGVHLSCSVCRSKQKIQDISYIRTGAPTGSNLFTKFEVKGNYSTKIEAVVSLVLDLKSQDSNVKILVFSTWIANLKFISEAFHKNDITSEILLSNNFEKRLEKFKDEERSCTALLLPVHLGSKGLNLIEATHVILVEPLLNPGSELQAIGRIHRIGQTRPTFVHKFITKYTIEESIFNAISQHTDDWDQNKVTLRQLKNLFIDIHTDTSNSVVIEENFDLSTAQDNHENYNTL